ncbi:probable xyloglucan galactosyltransferase GT11 [Cornus florida]|uniref:probable xyloglucan galactosyltransferase GT11 n=1 Tax=Cornus florida TaxID=4283 RepID=UPI002897F691|nr:probable xyloglucan galactosyltransferase GT11 [Cornus florida]
MNQRRKLSTTIRREKMDNLPQVARCRNKLWFFVFALFVLWYFLLYVYDWSSNYGLTPLAHSQTNSVEPSESTTWVETVDQKQIIEKKLEPSNRTFLSKNESAHEHDYDRENEEEPIKNSNWVDKKASFSPPIVEKISEPKPSVDSCSGRYIYVHDLPSRFNEDLLKQCRTLNKWTNMCKHIINVGLGKPFRSSGWFATNQFALEIIFHNRMKQYKCLTNDSSKASAIFVPFYAGLEVSRHLFDYNASMRDLGSLDLVKWLREKPEWNVMYGRDHFFVAGRITWDFRRALDEDWLWGNKLMMLPESKNMTILTIESSPWNKNDFAVPYPTYFHPSSDNEVFRWQSRMRKLKRGFFFSFVGAPRPNMDDSIRNEIIDQCLNSERKCKFLRCTDIDNKCNKPGLVMKIFQNSVFCLQPPGDSFTRRSTFDSILAGCIPVFFHPGSAYIQYLWHLPKNFNKYSVFIPEDLKNSSVRIERVLRGFRKAEIVAMREEVIKLIPKVIYADPRSRLKTLEDAFDITVKGVLERVETLREEMREGRNSSFDFDEEFTWKYNLFGKIEGKHEWDRLFKRTDKRVKQW